MSSGSTSMSSGSIYVYKASDTLIYLTRGYLAYDGTKALSFHSDFQSHCPILDVWVFQPHFMWVDSQP